MRSHDCNRDDLVTLPDGVDNLLVRRALDLAEDGMLAVEVWGGNVGYEELTAICLWSSIGHREDTRFGEFPPVLELVRERIGHLFPLEVKRPNPFRFWVTGSVSYWTTSLDHKVCNDPVEFEPVIVSLLR